MALKSMLGFGMMRLPVKNGDPTDFDYEHLNRIASPIYYHNLSGQLKCAIDRIYAMDKPPKLKKIAMFLSSGDDNMYTGAKFSYDGDFVDYLHLEGMGIFTNHEENVMDKIREMAASLGSSEEKKPC